MKELFLRIFIEVSNEIDANFEASNIGKSLEEWTNTNLLTVQRYWKIHEYFEIAFRLMPLDNQRGSSPIRDILGTGWEKVSRDEYLWRIETGGSFISPKARWAHLEELLHLL